LPAACAPSRFSSRTYAGRCSSSSRIQCHGPSPLLKMSSLGRRAARAPGLCSATPACEGRGQAGGGPLPRRPRRGSKGQRETGRQRGLATAAERSCWWTSRGGRSRRACARRPLRGGRSRHSGQLGPPPAPGCPRPERPGSPRPYLACARVTGNDAHTPRPRWGCWPTGPRRDEGGAGRRNEGGAGVAEDGQVERGCAARLCFLCARGNPREGSWLYGSTPEPTHNRTDQIA